MGRRGRYQEGSAAHLRSSTTAVKQRGVPKAPRHKALPDCLVLGKDPVPLLDSFRLTAESTRVAAPRLPTPARKAGAVVGSGKTRCARLLQREHRLVAVAVAVGDRFDQAVAIDVVARHRHACEIGRRRDEIGVLEPDRDR